MRMKSGTCERAIRLYEFIVSFFIQFGYMPNYIEMCHPLDTHSTAVPRYYMDILRRWKWIETDALVGRGIRLMRVTERGLTCEQLRGLWRPPEPEMQGVLEGIGRDMAQRHKATARSKAKTDSTRSPRIGRYERALSGLLGQLETAYSDREQMRARIRADIRPYESEG